ncbi:inositol-pentakisphosphate 2-kinase isoform X1 [Euwallacea similis]|uniref:inositol-pentakisphosphate 2-kinase isoform X1 n=1 Tax=Euwallacea similis TaxID=1736056 RepID=UPI00344CA832
MSDYATYENFTVPTKWYYRGEGNCNLVISLPKSKQILRIRKTERPKSILGWILVLINDFFQWYYGIEFSDEIRDLDFYSKIMRPLMGHKYTSESKLIVLSRKQMQSFRDGLAKKRPDFRMSKTLQYGRAALFADFAFLPTQFDNLQLSGNTYAVEIKPKQGWRPYKEQIHPHCFFCMNQYLKLEKKQIKSQTQYCPEELFSGDSNRMKSAINSLLQVPQNNFKIFKNGLICYDEKNKNIEILREIFESTDHKEILIDEFCDFLRRCLITDLGNESEIFNSQCKSICNLTVVNEQITLENTLPKGSVLNRILSVQMLDREGTHSTYKKLTKSDVWEDFSYVDKVLEYIGNKEHICSKCTIMDVSRRLENELLFLPYLVSAIAKDCSLMITFRKIREKPSDIDFNKATFETKYGMFVVNIGVFDLYPKPLSTIQKHYSRNRDIFRALKKCGLLT